MSTFSANVTQKIGGGAVINKTTVGNSTILTTSANQYAKVIISGLLSQLSGSGSVFSILLNSIAIKSVSAGSPGTYALHNGVDLAASGGQGIQFFEFLVPPSTALEMNFLVNNVATISAAGSYVLFENTP